MKIKQIAELIKKRKWVDLYQGEGEQWVSDGVAMYSLAVLVTEQQRAFLLQSRYLKPFEDVEALEFCLRQSPKGKSYITVHDGMFTVAVLLPFDDAGGALGAYIGALGAKLRAGRGGEADG